MTIRSPERSGFDPDEVRLRGASGRWVGHDVQLRSRERGQERGRPGMFKSPDQGGGNRTDVLDIGVDDICCCKRTARMTGGTKSVRNVADAAGLTIRGRRR